MLKNQVNIQKMSKISDYFTKKPSKSDQKPSKISNLKTNSCQQSQNEILTTIKTEVEENSNLIKSLPKMRECRVIFKDIRHDTQSKGIEATNEVKYEPEKQLLIILSPQRIIKPNKPIKIEEEDEDDSETDNLQCQTCNKKFRSVDSLKGHKKIHNKKFGCKICCKKFINNYKLLKHIENIHENPGNFKCDVCKVRYNTKAILSAHQKIHMKNRPKPFKCDRCDFATDNKASLNRHLKAHDKKTERCDKCNRILIKTRTHDCRLDCKFCGKICKTGFQTANHIKKCHAHQVDLVFFECDICGLKNRFKKVLMHHMDTKHADGKIQTFTCDLDGKTFKLKDKLVQHMKSHLPLVQCDICFIKVNIRSIKEHMNAHAGIKRSKPIIKPAAKREKIYCKICFRQFATKLILQRHIKDHNKTIKCKTCGRLFGSTSRLKTHIKEYHENPHGYTCEICGKKSQQHSNHKSHLKIHDKKRPKNLKCSECDFATDNKRSFVQHVNFHEKKKAETKAIKNPHKCPKCPTILKSKISWYKHIYHVHPTVLLECDICGRISKSRHHLLRHLQTVHKFKN